MVPHPLEMWRGMKRWRGKLYEETQKKKKFKTEQRKVYGYAIELIMGVG